MKNTLRGFDNPKCDPFLPRHISQAKSENKIPRSDVRVFNVFQTGTIQVTSIVNNRSDINTGLLGLRNDTEVF